ncbi:hypothetical protein FDP41_003822 [Naegleria fowleri]|uniref:Uncharacterized protein n=1 Tax=Naegleria fowleri TaxID=5763 RepID=A0A6A5BW68_NAEFO|nr:uncharacterized protein FDP41_003822 [Naegleria fowleri]KAF0977169.1 hypothetical protein FDP41_003822 [Naegleria fowleri]
MVLVEKGTNHQFAEEGRAYDPLVPKGNNITITFMFEIDNEPIRKATLKKFGRIEYNFKLQICKKGSGELIVSLPCKPTEDGRTTNEGMTSAVHFFSVPFSKEQIQFLRDNLDNVQVKLTVDDERYPHSTVLSPLLVKELLKDFD